MGTNVILIFNFGDWGSGSLNNFPKALRAEPGSVLRCSRLPSAPSLFGVVPPLRRKALYSLLLRKQSTIDKSSENLGSGPSLAAK